MALNSNSRMLTSALATILAGSILTACSSTQKDKDIKVKPLKKVVIINKKKKRARAKKKVVRHPALGNEVQSDVSDTDGSQSGKKLADDIQAAKPTRITVSPTAGPRGQEFGKGEDYRCKAKPGEDWPPGCFRYERKHAKPKMRP